MKFFTHCLWMIVVLVLGFAFIDALDEKVETKALIESCNKLKNPFDESTETAKVGIKPLKEVLETKNELTDSEKGAVFINYGSDDL